VVSALCSVQCLGTDSWQNGRPAHEKHGSINPEQGLIFHDYVLDD